MTNFPKQNTIKNQTEFFTKNKDIFLRYFSASEVSTGEQIYNRLIKNGHFEKMQEIIKGASTFSFEAWVNDHLVTGKLSEFKMMANENN